MDMCLRQLLDQVSSYVKNSNDTVLMLNALEELDDNMFFTACATAMHPNMSIEEGLTFLKIELNKLIFKADRNRPRKEIINTIKLLLWFNVFQFGDTCYRQKEGGAMDSPFTFLWSILTFATMETLVLIPKYEKNVIVFKRHAEDVFIIWRKQGEHDDILQKA